MFEWQNCYLEALGLIRYEVYCVDYTSLDMPWTAQAHPNLCSTYPYLIEKNLQY